MNEVELDSVSPFVVEVDLSELTVGQIVRCFYWINIYTKDCRVGIFPGL